MLKSSSKLTSKRNFQIRSASEKFDALLAVMKTLRHKCPWDKKQTHQSLKRYLLEEAYETFDAIARKEWGEVKEELGDLLLQILFHSEIASESKKFYIHDVIDAITNKLKNRHPHVFGNSKVKNAKEQSIRWDDFKLKEKKQSLLERVPRSMPALLQAYELQSRADRIGFGWSKIEEVEEKLEEEIREWIIARKRRNKRAMHEELGDLLFTITNLARWLKLNPEIALLDSNRKFRKRFGYVENAAKKQKKKLQELTPRELNDLWNQAKKV